MTKIFRKDKEISIDIKLAKLPSRKPLDIANEYLIISIYTNYIYSNL